MFKQSSKLAEEHMKLIEKWVLKHEVKEEQLLKKNLIELMVALKTTTDLKTTKVEEK